MKLLASVSVSYSAIRASARLIGATVAKVVGVIDVPRLRVGAAAYVLPIVAASFIALASTTSYVSPVASVHAATMKATVQPNIFLQDDVFVSDAVEFQHDIGFGLGLADAFTPSDTLVMAVSRTSSDIATATDAMAITFGSTLADSATAADALANAVGKALADAFTPSDALTVAVGSALADSATPSDALTSAVGKVLADSATVIDSLTTLLATELLLGDSFTPSDALTNAVGKALADAFTPSDALVMAVGLALADSATATDDLVPVISVGGSGNPIGLLLALTYP